MGALPIYLALSAAIVILIALIVRLRRRISQLEQLMSHTNERLEALQTSFGKFTPEEVIEHLTDPDGSYTPNMREVTVLFADLQGFTKMCSDLEPVQVISILNGYFRCMSEVIKKHHGQVTEMLGDGLLALFGALRNNPWQAQDAVLAALDMRRALIDYNMQLLAKGLPQLKFGVGIHKGEVLAAIMGDFELSKFGVVGDAINVASRVESLTRHHGVDVLISMDLAKSLDDRFDLKQMDPVHVKGKADPVVTYYVQGMTKKRPLASGG